MTAAGEDCDVPVSTDDVYETVMTLTGLKNPNGATDGVSLANLLHDPDADIGRESIHWHYPHYRHDGQSGGKPSSAVRRGDWKLYYFYEGQDYELYNLAADIGESHNLAHDRPDMLHLLSTDLHNWLKDTGAQMPIYTETGQPAPLPAITPEPTGAALLISGAVGLCAGPRRRARAPRRAPAPRG
jgi:arylsulfatase A-like enzyme